MNPLRFTMRGLMALVAVVAMILALPTLYNSLVFTGFNCFGNNGALSHVRMYSLILNEGASRNADHPFRFEDANPDERAELKSIARGVSCQPARFLVAQMPYRPSDDKHPRLLIVSDTPFGNVPRPFFRGTGTMGHAAGYSDGTCRLLTTAEYRSLDLVPFRPLDELLPDW